MPVGAGIVDGKFSSGVRDATLAKIEPNANRSFALINPRLNERLGKSIVILQSVFGELANRVFDVWVMLGFGALGVLMHALKIPTAPFVIGFILAPLAEEKLYAGLQASSGSFRPLFTRPIAATFVLIAAILFLMPFYRRGRELIAVRGANVDAMSEE